MTFLVVVPCCWSPSSIAEHGFDHPSSSSSIVIMASLSSPSSPSSSSPSSPSSPSLSSPSPSLSPPPPSSSSSASSAEVADYCQAWGHAVAFDAETWLNAGLQLSKTGPDRLCGTSVDTPQVFLIPLFHTGRKLEILESVDDVEPLVNIFVQ